MCKATAHQRENNFFFGKLLFPILTKSNSIGYYAIALKFSAKQINLIRKESVSAIFETMNINIDFRIFGSVSHRNTNRIKAIFLKKSHGHLSRML